MTRYRRISTPVCSASAVATGVGADVEADDDGVGRIGQQRRRTWRWRRHPPWMTRTRTSSLESLLKGLLDGLRGALDVGLDDDGQFLHIALAAICVEQVIQRDLADRRRTASPWLLAVRLSASSRARRSSSTASNTLTGLGHFGQAGDLHGRGGASLGRSPGHWSLRHGTHTANGGAGDQAVALMQGTVLDQQVVAMGPLALVQTWPRRLRPLPRRLGLAFSSMTSATSGDASPAGR